MKHESPKRSIQGELDKVSTWADRGHEAASGLRRSQPPWTAEGMACDGLNCDEVACGARLEPDPCFSWVFIDAYSAPTAGGHGTVAASQPGPGRTQKWRGRPWPNLGLIEFYLDVRSLVSPIVSPLGIPDSVSRIDSRGLPSFHSRQRRASYRPDSFRGWSPVD